MIGGKTFFEQKMDKNISVFVFRIFCKYSALLETVSVMRARVERPVVAFTAVRMSPAVI